MERSISAGAGLSQSMSSLERKLVAAITILIVAIAMMIGTTIGQPVITYLGGTEATVSAVMEGAGCASHLEWTASAEPIRRGTTIHFENETVYWQVPIVIERASSDGSAEIVAASPPIKDGERWSYTFWRGGEYRIVSGQQVQQLAGLDTTLRIEK